MPRVPRGGVGARLIPVAPGYSSLYLLFCAEALRFFARGDSRPFLFVRKECGELGSRSFECDSSKQEDFAARELAGD